MTAHDLLDGIRSLVCVVERNCADIVVQNVSFNDSVEKLSTDETEFSIDCGRCSSSIRPALAGVVRQGRIGVLKVGDGNQPVIDPEIWKPVPDKHVEVAELLAQSVEHGTDDSQTEIAEEDQVGILCFIQRAPRVEVVDTTEETIPLSFPSTLFLVFVVVVTGNVGKDVQWPPSKLLTDQVQSSRNRGFFRQLMELVSVMTDSTSIYFSCLWDEDHVSFHVTGSLVVLAVGNLPREVWH